MFGTLRDGCPHKGVDYSSSQRPKDFVAGVYGTVVEPEESGWGTIAVVPFANPQYKIQYLHASARYVSVGDVVQPWTLLGATGDVAPPGSGITGIHLHLQIQDVASPSTQPCWAGREFVDPERWTITNPLIGTWHVNESAVVKGVTIERTKSITIFGDEINSRVTGRSKVVAVYPSPSGKLYTAVENYEWNGRVVSHQKHALVIETFKGTCNNTVNGAPSPWQCVAKPGVGELTMTSATTVTFGDLSPWRKVP
ncbi:MAG: peptidoglycan DD-metalloendopeptidase family protein [Kofleriaceae bacterium]|nr:peptidoglycan DD-metalloendopeptidase family protein [Kofleriaceae bacterium]